MRLSDHPSGRARLGGWKDAIFISRIYLRNLKKASSAFAEYSMPGPRLVDATKEDRNRRESANFTNIRAC